MYYVLVGDHYEIVWGGGDLMVGMPDLVGGASKFDKSLQRAPRSEIPPGASHLIIIDIPFISCNYGVVLYVTFLSDMLSD